MRIRYTNNDVPVTYTLGIAETHLPANTVTHTTETYAGKLPENAQGAYMEDVVTPRFRNRSAKGDIIINPMLSLACERNGTLTNFGGITFDTYDEANGTTVRFDVSGSMPISALPGINQGLLSDIARLDPATFGVILNDYYDYDSVADTESGVLAKCISNASSDEGALSLVTAAELHKTADMLHSMGSSLTSVVRLIRNYQSDGSVLRSFARLTFAEIKLLAKYARFNGKGPRFIKNLGLTPLGVRRLSGLCGLWLGYRYGIMATYYDVMSWQRSINSHRVRQRFTSSTTTRYEDTNSSVLTGNPFFDDTRSVRYARTTISTAGCLVAPEIDGLHDLHGAGRILSTGWELLPLSFVLDWFYDVSTRIGALETSFLRPVVGSWIVHRSKLTRTDTFYQAGKTTVEGSAPNRITRVGYGGRGCASTLTTKMVVRKANPTVSYLPQIKVNLNWKRLADGVALSVVLRKNLASILSQL